MALKLVLIDGHSILHRAFYGVPELTNGKGLHTNAVYGFLNIMFKILAVAFDVHAPTFRHEIYKEYKGTRKPMPTELREQVPVMKQMLQAMGICVVEQAGLEADDILGTIAKRAEREGMEVSLVSGDRDLLQVATDHIRIRIPKTKAGRTQIEDYYAKDVEAAYQVNPIQFIDLKALMGDTADNIPGVPKVGEKTATELMVAYGSLDNIYAHVEEISKKSIRESLIANRELADLSKVLATINVDAEIAFDFEQAKMGDFYTEEAYVLCKQLEFKNILSRFTKDVAVANGQEEYFRTQDVYKLKPMMLKTLAEITGLDFSTISRATNNKFVQTPWGIYPLRFFFSDTKGDTAEGEDAATNRKIEASIKALIDKEDKRKPLSDRRIADMLAASGLDISRRTVAKYRDRVRIPVARLRKEL